MSLPTGPIVTGPVLPRPSVVVVYPPVHPPLRMPPQAPPSFFTRLGLIGGAPFATGKVFILQPDGTVAGQLHNYKLTSDGRLMLFPVAVGDARIDAYSAQLNTATNTLACQFTGIHLTLGKNTGSGYLNFALGGTGPLTATMQNMTTAVPGNQRIILPDQSFRVMFVPD